MSDTPPPSEAPTAATPAEAPATEHVSAVAGETPAVPPPPPGWAYVSAAGASSHLPPPPPGLAYVPVGPPGGPARPAGSWRGRRVPLLATVAALLLGCVLGAGVTAIGAAVAGHHRGGGHHDQVGPAGNRFGTERGGFGRDGRRGDGRTGDRGGVPGTAPSAATPAPSASS
ncbi:hypothetical protein BJY16_008382 [Actinoplanes octamycinicus]|uniref:Uncharacterized protein n=1 Tax=Actinoplanes octamycinicus TaxID=135948 RepID=A0A7W7H6R8_9ACTN|nr:hypothetical protein [Actinoplanes octamycinicus]MBB4744923.1 hypothetical protein [Actinoplanes octamycinicus]GIE55508.1 hypothetical protein Aoc01nite_09100 [Actinoplanes octamycinicus]